MGVTGQCAPLTGRAHVPWWTEAFTLGDIDL
jgi:hypothetical protein